MDQNKYGLIRLSKADKQKTTLKRNIFDSDSDEEKETTSKKISTSSGIRRQTQLDISRALTEDPNVFEYDNIYDDMKSKKESVVDTDIEKKERPKPKYINNLLKFSENRKKENERRLERKIQKERESEGNEFEDKEQFVTNAYKEKLNEMKAEDERDRKEQAIEELLDVKKQKDLSGFYRHLLNNDITPQNKDSVETLVPQKQETEVGQQFLKTTQKPKTNRQIRRRKSSSDESSEETTQSQEPEAINRQKSRENIHQKEDFESKNNESNDENKDFDIKLEKNDRIIVKHIEKDETKSTPKLSKREILLKIFTKRTVGELLNEALIRYLQRKDNYVI